MALDGVQKIPTRSNKSLNGSNETAELGQSR